MLTVFGLMGWLEFNLDITTLMTAPIIIGIAVDDTIHFITHYRLSLVKGASITEAIHDTLHEVGTGNHFHNIDPDVRFFSSSYRSVMLVFHTSASLPSSLSFLLFSQTCFCFRHFAVFCRYEFSKVDNSIHADLC
jgi:hypothetical protein